MRNTVRQGATRRGTATQSKRAARMRFQPYSPAEVGQAAQPVYMHIRQLAERLVERPRLGRMWQELLGRARSIRSQVLPLAAVGYCGVDAWYQSWRSQCTNRRPL